MSPTAARRTVLSVPASNPRMVDKARDLAVDEVFLDLEDAVAPAAKAAARDAAAAAVREQRWRAATVAVRVNGWATPWTAVDVDAVVSPGARLQAVILPKVESPDDVVRLDRLLARAEENAGLAVGGVGLEVQIESAAGLTRVDEIARSSDRVQALVFGPVDFMADLGMRADSEESAAGLVYPLMRILTSARAQGLQAIDGPYVKVRDVDGFRRSAARAAALGYDGKWVLHPDQVEPGNAAFTPSVEDFRHACELLSAYDAATAADGDRRGAVMFGDEMIDEASRRLAAGLVARGRAAGMSEEES